MRREKTIISSLVLLGIFLAVLIVGGLVTEDMLLVDLGNTFRMPSLKYIFGTDWVGRNMLFRVLKGLSLSIRIGLLCSLCSSVIAMILGILGPVIGGRTDAFISWFIDLVLSVPHTILIILISLSLGGGLLGISVGVIFTHWTGLTRIIRVQVMQIKEAEYTKISQRMGKSRFYIAREHLFPHIIPQLVVGTVLIFPHAILHEAAVTFLGFGLPSHEPAIGIILSESMKYLTSGYWWLAFFPGASLVILSLLVDKVGKNIEMMLNQATAYEGMEGGPSGHVHSHPH